MSPEEILDDYPMLEDNHIRAALSFAADRESFIKIIPTYANYAIQRISTKSFVVENGKSKSKIYRANPNKYEKTN